MAIAVSSLLHVILVEYVLLGIWERTILLPVVVEDDVLFPTLRTEVTLKCNPIEKLSAIGLATMSCNIHCLRRVLGLRA